MMKFDLTIRNILERPRDMFPQKEIYSRTRTGEFRYTYADMYKRTCRLANALAKLGVKRGDRVGTLAWNHHRHLELYLAVPCYGAVLNTLNLRLFEDQLAYVINHAEDKVIFADDDLLPLLERIKDKLGVVEKIVVMTDEAELPETSFDSVVSYEELLSEASEDFEFPDDIDEWSPAAMCYTTATTGDPKGVVYTHRSIYLHSLTMGLTDTLGLGERDVVLPMVPMFHVNAWSLPFAAAWFGAKQVFPRHDLGGEAICKLIETEKVSFTGGVPTLMQGILRHLETGAKHDLSSLRKTICGGAAVPRSLNKAYRDKLGVSLTQGYGMTETSPLLVLSNLKSHMDDWSDDDILDVLAKQGTLVPGLEMKIVNDQGEKLAHDGIQVGEILVRGPWVAGEYYNEPEKTKELIVDGWLRTGDIAKIDSEGYVQIVDRSKDLIKSGGEWISSVDLENAIMGHPDVVEAAVVAIPDEKWQERPMAVVVLKEGASVTDRDILDFLADKIVKWWMPDKVIFIDELPKTSVGKFDKKVLRREYVE